MVDLKLITDRVKAHKAQQNFILHRLELAQQLVDLIEQIGTNDPDILKIIAEWNAGEIIKEREAA